MLKGYPDIYRIASGEYRIVYQWDDSHVYVLVINRRNDDEVYRHLARKKLI
jgi:mRNA interferase RelE/StbE